MIFTRLHGDISRNTEHFIVTAVRTSSPAYQNHFEVLSTLLVSRRRCHVVLLFSDVEMLTSNCLWTSSHMSIWGLPKRPAAATKVSPCLVVHPAVVSYHGPCRLSMSFDKAMSSNDRGKIGRLDCWHRQWYLQFVHRWHNYLNLLELVYIFRLCSFWLWRRTVW
jgi:hypothetical protein